MAFSRTTQMIRQRKSQRRRLRSLESLEPRHMFTGPPVITSNGGGATAVISVAENTASVSDVDANDFSADRTAAINTYDTQYAPTLSVPNGWTGSVATCDPGTNSVAYQDATESMLNYFRDMTGLPDINLDPALDAEAMEAALMMQANNALSHGPPTTWDCYTATGAAAAGSSNLYLGRTGPSAMSGYIEDPGSGNYFVGHRRWILYPRMVTMGSGSTSNANALKVFGPGTHGSRPTSPDWVSWPPAGFVPQDVVYPRWSLSSNDFPLASFDGAVVTMSSDGVPISLNQNPVNNGGFGDRTLVWEPQGLTLTNNQTITVNVANIVLDGGPPTSYSYDVTIIDPAVGPSGSGLTYALAPTAADNGLFSINSTTGDLAFITAPDYENPQDTGGNNVYDLQVTVTDAYGLTDTQAISVTVTDVAENDAVPNITTSSPVNLTAHPPGSAVTIAGTAGDDNSVIQVNLAIYNDALQTWNGTAFTSDYSIVVASLGSPNATTTSWTYDFTPPATGTYAVRATAVDDAFQVRQGWWYTFLIGTDTASPTITVANPATNNSVLTGPLSGSASDDRGVNRVAIVIYDSANQTWDGTSFTSTYSRVNADLGTLNGTTTTWSYDFNPSPGIYTFRATVIDVVNKQTNGPWRTFEVSPAGPPLGVADSFVQGDTDRDGDVDFADFLALSQNFGSVDAVWGDGDFDNDGTVSFGDFLALSANFGRNGQN